jgi:transcriptional regulator with XRE-family HTH domain
VNVIADGLKEQARRVGSIGEFIREQREQAQVSVRQLATLAGVSNPYLSQIERGLRAPSETVLKGIAEALQTSAEALREEAGVPLEPDGESSVVQAIHADPRLTAAQRRALLEIYKSFIA